MCQLHKGRLCKVEEMLSFTLWLYVTTQRANRTHHGMQAEEYFDECVKHIMWYIKGIVAMCATYYGMFRGINSGGLGRNGVGKIEEGLKNLVECNQVADQYACLTESCA